MARWTTQWLLSLYLFLIFVQGSQDADEAYKYGRNLVLEYFLPINAPAAVEVPLRKEKRDVEGSGEDDAVFSELKDKTVEDVDNSTKMLEQDGRRIKSAGGLESTEGSGEVEDTSECWTGSSEEGENCPDALPAAAEAEASTTTTASDEVTGSTVQESQTQVKTERTSTEMIFDKSEDFADVQETTTPPTETTPAVILDLTATASNEEIKTTTSREPENTTEPPETEQETTAADEFPPAATETTTGSPTDPTTAALNPVFRETVTNGGSSPAEAAATATGEEAQEFTTTAHAEAETLTTVVVPRQSVPEESPKTVISRNGDFDTLEDTTKIPATEVPENAPTGPEPVVEAVFKETKPHKDLEALPGNILQKENLSLPADPLLVANTRLMDSEETVQLSSSEPKRLGAYVVIGLILLSFSSLVGYITFRKRMNRKRQELERNQESNDTEKALLSLSDYKDSSELEENHLKNNEITPIVVKSNTQINKFEKNTNFSSPKNLNMIANEKNIEKDNVLKSTAENLTQVIIEGSAKDMDDDKNVPNMEKLIVKTRIDQDSIPKKPIIINRSSTGYMPIPQDNA